MEEKYYTQNGSKIIEELQPDYSIFTGNRERTHKHDANKKGKHLKCYDSGGKKRELVA